MGREEIYFKLTDIFRDVFDDDGLEVNDTTSSKDVEGWDSLEHANLIANLESEFDIEFEIDEINQLNNVGEMVTVIAKKMQEKS